MTSEEAKDLLTEIAGEIVSQNRDLMQQMDKPDFDPSISLDNTRNDAGNKLTRFFDVLKCFSHGCVPYEVTDDVLSTTDELIMKIRKKYASNQAVVSAAVLVGQAFRSYNRVWRTNSPVRVLPQEEFDKQMDEALYRILCALDELNFQFNMMPAQQPVSPENAIVRKIDQSTVRIIRAVKGEEGTEIDKRSPQQRRMIDRGVELYVYRHYVQGVELPESNCYRMVWRTQNGCEAFANYRQFENAAHYDLQHSYDLEVLTAKVRAHPPV